MWEKIITKELNFNHVATTSLKSLTSRKREKTTHYINLDKEDEICIQADRERPGDRSLTNEPPIKELASSSQDLLVLTKDRQPVISTATIELCASEIHTAHRQRYQNNDSRKRRIRGGLDAQNSSLFSDVKNDRCQLRSFILRALSADGFLCNRTNYTRYVFAKFKQPKVFTSSEVFRKATSVLTRVQMVFSRSFFIVDVTGRTRSKTRWWYCQVSLHQIPHLETMHRLKQNLSTVHPNRMRNSFNL